MSEVFAQYDLHSHCLWSYDAATPIEYYFRRAQELHLKAFAITDHHNFDAFPEILEVSRNFPDVCFIPGAEMTARHPLWCGDMVCLGLPQTPGPKLRKVFDRYHKMQIEWGEALCRLVQKRGFHYDAEERRKLLKLYRPERTFAVQGITHVRNEIQRDHLISIGAVKDAQDYGNLCWKANCLDEECKIINLMEANEIIDAVHESGGVVLIAHPYGYFHGLNEKRMDEVMEAIHFDGIECAHSSVPEEATRFYRKYCEKHHLLSSGGTDCHEAPGQTPYHLSDDCTFGQHCGEPQWLDEILERVTIWKAGERC